QMCDGYDIGAIGWSVPSLTHAWNLPPAAFTMAFAFSNIGIMAGALIAGPLGDRFGRRPLLLASILVFGLASLLTATVSGIGMLAVYRFFTGLGIAGTFAGTVALTGDYAPRHRGAARRLCRRPDRRLPAASRVRLAGHLRARRRLSAGFARRHARLAAGIAALSRPQAEPGAASGGAARAPRHRRRHYRRGRRCRRQPRRDAVRQGLRGEDGAAVDHLLLQP